MSKLGRPSKRSAIAKKMWADRRAAGLASNRKYISISEILDEVNKLSNIVRAYKDQQLKINQ